MEFWNSQAEQLEKKLLEHMPELMLHYLRTATDETLSNLVGEALPASENTRSSIIAHLVASLECQVESRKRPGYVVVLDESAAFSQLVFDHIAERRAGKLDARSRGEEGGLSWTEVQS